MSVYMTETEQLEAIKSWWKRYNNIIIISLSVILLSISAYKYWHWHQDKIKQQASMAYEQLMLAFSNQDYRGVRAYANQLLSEYGQTIYADAARLTLAKLYVSREQYTKAEDELEAVVSHAHNESFKQMAKIRLVRVLLGEKSYDTALSILGTLGHSPYLPIVNELKGDIYAATKRYEQAVSAYRQAIHDAQKHGMGNLFLEMKANELAAMTQSMNTYDHQVTT